MHSEGRMSTIRERLRNRALARLTLKKPSKIDEADAALDCGAADTIDALVTALESALEWDRRRGYLLPYKVRDPMNAALAKAKGKQE